MASTLQKPWFRKSCCRGDVLILLTWQVLFVIAHHLFSFGKAVSVLSTNDSGFHLLHFLALLANFGFAILAPFVGWLADVKLGRYKVVLFGTLISLSSNIIFFSGLQIKYSMIGKVLLGLGMLTEGLGDIFFLASMLPFMTDQLVGASAAKLGAVVYWYYWIANLSLFCINIYGCLVPSINAPVQYLQGISTLVCVAFLAGIIISDCLCQQWLVKTHKVTNPIKLIIQVLNYTRKHRYPERRSAFTYIDEEQPTRMDFGKNKFGGPFTEEEVEDVKTVLRLLPLVACISFSVTTIWPLVHLNALDSVTSCMFNLRAIIWLPPLVLIPLCQFLIYPYFHRWVPTMLKRIEIGLVLQLVGLMLAMIINGSVHWDDFLRYATCKQVLIPPDLFMKWYWKLLPLVPFAIGNAVANVLLLEFVIAQSPDKMKGLTFGLSLAFGAISRFIVTALLNAFHYTMCYDLPTLVMLVVLFIVFMVLSRRYTLRQRNREINIQAIVEEHHERYLDQEEEYARENPRPQYYDPSLEYSDSEQSQQTV